MRSIKIALLALALLGLGNSAALAFGHDHGGQGGGRGESEASRGGPRGGGQIQGYPGGDVRYERGRRGDAPQAYSPRGYAPLPYDRSPYSRDGRYMGEAAVPAYAPAPRAFRRGQYIPRDFWAGGIADPHSRHLRTPPPGYRWVGVGRNAYLMQRSTGLILDSVPGAY